MIASCGSNYRLLCSAIVAPCGARNLMKMLFALGGASPWPAAAFVALDWGDQKHHWKLQEAHAQQTHCGMTGAIPWRGGVSVEPVRAPGAPHQDWPLLNHKPILQENKGLANSQPHLRHTLVSDADFLVPPRTKPLEALLSQPPALPDFAPGAYTKRT